MKNAVFAVFALLLTATPAFAAVDDAGAGVLKSHVEAMIADAAARAKIDGRDITLAAPVTVAPKGNFYEVKLPGLVFVHEKGKLHIGNITMNASPGKADEYLVSMALPSKMSFIENGAEKSAFDIKIGTQKFAGEWHPALSSFTRLDASYSDLSLIGNKGAEFTLGAAALNIKINMTENADKTWSGPVVAELKNVKAEGKSDKVSKFTLTLDSSVAKKTYDSINLKAAKDLNAKIANILADKNAATNPALAKKAAGEIVQQAAALLNGETNLVTTTNLHMAMTPNAATSSAKPMDLKLKSLTSSYTASGLQKERGHAKVATKFDGFSIAGIPEAFAGIVPSSGNFDIAIDSLPMKSLIGTLSDVFATAVGHSLEGPEAEKTPDQMKAESDMANKIVALPGAMSDAGSTITVRDTFIKSNDLDSFLSGKFTAQAIKPGTKALPATGSMTLAFHGLDELSVKMQTMAATDPSVATYTQMLGVIQMMGQPGKTAAGKSQRSYKLDLTPEGQVLLNGADISLMGAMLQGMPKQP